jgi:hypothetical protein
MSRSFIISKEEEMEFEKWYSRWCPNPPCPCHITQKPDVKKEWIERRRSEQAMAQRIMVGGFDYPDL